MRNELMAFFSDTKESAGLLVAEAPTGYGKTYEMVQAIYQYVRYAAWGGSRNRKNCLWE